MSRRMKALCALAVLASGVFVPDVVPTASAALPTAIAFGSVTVGLQSAGVTRTVPFSVAISELPNGKVLFDSSDSAVVTTATNLGWTLPITTDEVKTKQPNVVFTYAITGFTSGGPTFPVLSNTCVGAAAGATTCDVTIAFQPFYAIPGTDVVSPVLAGLQVSGLSDLTLQNLFNLISPTLQGTVGPLLGVPVSGNGVTGAPAITPADNAFNVPRDVQPRVTFATTMNAATLTGRVRLFDLAANAYVTTTLVYDAVHHWVTVRPSALLAAARTYQLRLSAGILDSFGGSVPTATRQFSVSLDGAAPVVSGRSPAAGAVNIGRTANVLVTWNENVRSTTVTTATVRLQDTVTGSFVTATVTYSASLRLATLNPSVTLAARRTYRVYATNGVRDAAGNPAVAANWTFTTGL